MPSLRGMASGRSSNGGKGIWRGMKGRNSERKAMARKGEGGRNEMVSQWMEHASEVQMREMKEAFTFFDDNKDGMITEQELACALERLGDTSTAAEVHEMFEEADTNHDGVISFDEFIALQGRVGDIYRRQEGIFQQDLRLAFLRFDADGNGLISPEELQSVLARLGRPSSLPDCRHMISRVDLDGDGHINFQEFLFMMKD